MSPGDDMYRRIAAQVLDIPPEDVTPQLRSFVKWCSLGARGEDEKRRCFELALKIDHLMRQEQKPWKP